MRIKDIMNTDLFTLNEDDTISDVADVMKLKKIRHIPVVDKNYTLVGLVTHRDLISALAGKIEKLSVKNIMQKEVKAVLSDTPLKGAMEVMILNKYGCLPVVGNDRKLLGIVTEIDLLKVLYEMSSMPSDFYIKPESKKTIQ